MLLMSLHLGNLSSCVHRDELERVFRRFGHCNVRVKDKFGFVVYDYPRDDEKALKTLRGKWSDRVIDPMNENVLEDGLDFDRYEPDKADERKEQNILTHRDTLESRTSRRLGAGTWEAIDSRNGHRLRGEPCPSVTTTHRGGRNNHREIKRCWKEHSNTTGSDTCDVVAEQTWA
ncbi:hypothetical protein RND71_007184 [Anisodus tanguticus]|uniref:RRM domain-containing protein n=1 Tax=Anisodus tanguticus TaxID=243964 RepID=A0AAE1VTD6_9SOLA|nr:hypothetical protein RND71_007184 [Anisodus tanguticus]